MASDDIKTPTYNSAESNVSNLSTEIEQITDEEEDDVITVDPFQHRLTLSTLQWTQTIILGMFLVPIRLVLILTFMLLMWIVSSISLRLVNKGESISNIWQ